MLTLSYSRIDSYLRCPNLYMYKYELGLEPEAVSSALILGSAVHGTIAHYYRQVQVGHMLTTEELERSFSEDFEARTTVPVKWSKGATPDKAKEHGFQLIKAYVDHLGENIIMPVAVEQELRSDLVNPITGEKMPGIQILGFCDRIDSDGTISELKTSSRRYNQFQVDTALQADMYSYLVHRHDGQDEVNVRYEILVKNKSPRAQFLSTTRNAGDWAVMFNIIQQIVYSIMDKRFYPNRGYNCATCDFCSRCFGVLKGAA